MAKKPAIPVHAPDEFLLERAREKLEALKPYRNAILAAICLLALGALFLAWRSAAKAAANQAAWEDFYQAEKRLEKKEDPGFPELLKRHAGTSAEPYILLAYASQLYRSKEPGDLEKAVAAYEKLDSRFGSHPLVGEIAAKAFENVKKEAAFAAPTAGATPVKTTGPEKAPPSGG